jgi:GT2 family glycosyltransferase
LDRPTFNKSCAHNAGAWRAIHEGAEYLCFLDADTVVLPGFGEYVARHVRPGKFLIAGLAPGGVDVASLTGLLVVPARAFAAVGGFDESFQGWGGEDIELRLRLHLVGGLSYGEVPLELLHPIQHDDSLRTRFYEERSVARSNATNMQRIREKMRSWPARPESSARLWFRRGAELVQPSRAATQPGEYRPEHPRRAAAARVARAVTRPRRVS